MVEADFKTADVSLTVPVPACMPVVVGESLSSSLTTLAEMAAVAVAVVEVEGGIEVEGGVSSDPPPPVTLPVVSNTVAVTPTPLPTVTDRDSNSDSNCGGGGVGGRVMDGNSRRSEDKGRVNPRAGAVSALAVLAMFVAPLVFRYVTDKK